MKWLTYLASNTWLSACDMWIWVKVIMMSIWFEKIFWHWWIRRKLQAVTKQTSLPVNWIKLSLGCLHCEVKLMTVVQTWVNTSVVHIRKSRSFSHLRIMCIACYTTLTGVDEHLQSSSNTERNGNCLKYLEVLPPICFTNINIGTFHRWELQWCDSQAT